MDAAFQPCVSPSSGDRADDLTETPIDPILLDIDKQMRIERGLPIDILETLTVQKALPPPSDLFLNARQISQPPVELEESSTISWFSGYKIFPDDDQVSRYSTDKPEGFGNESELNLNNKMVSEQHPQKRATSNPARASKKRVKKYHWDADHVLQDPKSQLATTDLKAVFANPKAFEVLSPEERAKIVALCPANIIALDACGVKTIDPEFLKHSPDWSHSISCFKEDIAEGRNDPVWIAQAMAASTKREQGHLDDYKDTEYEEFWGIKQKLPPGVLAGSSSSQKLEALFKACVLKFGDVFSFSRNFKVPGGNTLVEKEAIVTEYDVRKDTFTVSYPPGQYKFSNPSERADIVADDVKGPEALVSKLIEEDGRITQPPNGNGWKVIRVIRNNQDLGTLWDIRQAFQFSQSEGNFFHALFGGATRHKRRLHSSAIAAGYFRVTPYNFLVKKILLSDVAKQPPNSILPTSLDLALALLSIAPPSYVFVNCDYRILEIGDIPVPELFEAGQRMSAKDTLEKVLLEGPGAFPTDFTRAIAGRSAFGSVDCWSGGHAHVGPSGLGVSQHRGGAKPRSADGKARKKLTNLDAPQFAPSVPVSEAEKEALKALLDTYPMFQRQNVVMIVAGDRNGSSDVDSPDTEGDAPEDSGDAPEDSDYEEF